mmetsp:Transcript_18555/g.32486  ORF Transcript_18555/g.32486 Transcript_18555/m.32486 type:complete len:642 (-) Transcript_18555:254-2179(-)
MNKAVIGALVMTVFTRQALGHGAVTKPMPRAVTGHQWCPWCVGEHHPDTNPYGKVHHDAMPSSPCLGSIPGDSPYEPVHYSGYRDLTEEGESSYAAGGALDARILLEADHAGEARWSYCPHSEDQTEDCFRQRPLTDWIDVHAFWGGASTQDHWKDGEDFPQTVNLPAGMPSGPTTLRWLWICKFTDEIFASCLDTTITGGASTSSTSAMTTTTTTGSGETTATTSSGDTTSTTSSSGERDCIWTEPAGREVKRVSREEKDGRICWDVRVEAGTTVYYQSNTDIYISWNTMPCCLSAASTFGSDSGGNEANIVAFNNSIGSFGFCECTAWDPNNPDASCSGGAAATSMVCPVNGASDGMCPGASDWDGIPVACTPPYTGSTTSTTTTTSMSTSDFELLSDADQACRGISSSDNSDSYYNLHSGVGSLGECQAKCIELSNLCQGIEYNRATGRCEVWTRAGGIQATRTVTGYSCYRYNPDAETGTTITSIVTTTVTTAQAATTSTTGDVASCGQMNDHCGGQHFQGTECCVSGLICKQRDDHYSQCEKDGSSTYLCAQIWEQCGGNGWTGATCCAEGLSCVADNAYYSQCQRVSLVQRAVMDSRRLRGPRSRRSLSKALMANPMLVQKASKIIASQAKHAEF